MAQEPNSADNTKTTTINQAQAQEDTSERETKMQKEQNTMFDFELKVPEIESVETWADRTCVSKRSLKRFLATLTPTQLAHAEVVVDEESYIVFYPILTQQVASGGPHFDDGLAIELHTASNFQPKIAVAIEVGAECSNPSAHQSEFSELTQDEWDKALGVLLSSVKLL